MKKMIKEKKTGEMYSSKAAMMKHEKGESMKDMMKEYKMIPPKKKMPTKSKSKMTMKKK